MRHTDRGATVNPATAGRDGDQSAVFTPENEPYLGCPGVQHFDEMIVLLMETHHRIGPWSRGNTLNSLQGAVCQLAPQATSLLLGMRELLRQAYLLPAAVLLRPALERIATLSWLCEHPDQVHRWHEGWKHGDRPNLAKRMESMHSRAGPRGDVEAGAREVRDHFNGLVHGDPDSANMGAILLPDGQAGFSVSKDLGSPARASGLAFQGAMYATVLIARCNECFPDAGREQEVAPSPGSRS